VKRSQRAFADADCDPIGTIDAEASSASVAHSVTFSADSEMKRGYGTFARSHRVCCRNTRIRMNSKTPSTRYTTDVMLNSPLLKPASQINAAVPGTRPSTAFRHLKIAHAARNEPTHVAVTMITITGSG